MENYHVSVPPLDAGTLRRPASAVLLCAVFVCALLGGGFVDFVYADERNSSCATVRVLIRAIGTLASPAVLFIALKSYSSAVGDGFRPKWLRVIRTATVAICVGTFIFVHL